MNLNIFRASFLVLFFCQFALAGDGGYFDPYLSKALDPCWGKSLSKWMETMADSMKDLSPCTAAELRAGAKDCRRFSAKPEDAPETKEEFFGKCLASHGRDSDGRCPSSNLTESDIVSCLGQSSSSSKALYADFQLWRTSLKKKARESQCLFIDKCGDALAKMLAKKMELPTSKRQLKKEFMKAMMAKRLLDDCGEEDPEEKMMKEVQNNCGIGEASSGAIFVPSPGIN